MKDGKTSSGTIAPPSAPSASARKTPNEPACSALFATAPTSMAAPVPTSA